MNKTEPAVGDAGLAAGPMRLRALVADDHVLVREEVVTILNASSEVEVVAEAADGAEAASKALETRPDIVVLDVSMPKLSGAETARRIHDALPQTRILALTIHEEEEYVARMVAAGASGYLLKDAAPYELLVAIRALRSGKSYFSPRVIKTLAGAIRRSGKMR